MLTSEIYITSEHSTIHGHFFVVASSKCIALSYVALRNTE
jgi:hypothetical protein